MKRTLLIVKDVLGGLSVLVSVLSLPLVPSLLPLWQEILANTHPALLLAALVVVGLLLGEGFRYIVGFVPVLGKRYSEWLRPEDVPWGLQVRGLMRHPAGYVPPDPKFNLDWKTVSVRAPWSERIDSGADPLWLTVVFAGRGAILGRFRLRTPVEKHRMDGWNAQYSISEVGDWRQEYLVGDSFFRYRIPKIGGFSGPIGLDPVLKGEFTHICHQLPVRFERRSWPFEIADIDCMRQLLIVYSVDKAGISTSFPRPGRLAIIPTNRQTGDVREGEGVAVNLSMSRRHAEPGCQLPEKSEDGGLQCVLAFRQADSPNKNPRLVDELVIVTHPSTRGSLTVYWK